MRALLLVVVVLIAAVPAARAHGEGGRTTGFASTVKSVVPDAQGLELGVVDGDDRLRLENESGLEVVVLGYDGEPYLRFAGGAVFENVRSPAVYLNADRYAQGEVPATADPEAPPVWRRVELGDSYEWHDHRIQWMSTITPDEIRADPGSPRHVFDWEVPLLVDGRPAAVTGSLDYAPAEEGLSTWVFVAATAPVAAAVLGWVVFRRRFGPAAAATE
jgi:hypothetical protein